MEMDRVFREPVVRRQVHPAAEPPYRVGAPPVRDEEAHVEMHRRRVGIARVQDQRHAGRFPCAARKLGAMRRRRRGQRVPRHVREQHAAALENGAVLDPARKPAAAFGPCPRAAGERLAAERLRDRRRSDPAGRRNTRVARRRPRSWLPRRRARDGRCRCGTACRRSGGRRPPHTRHAAPGAPNRRARSRTARGHRRPRSGRRPATYLHGTRARPGVPSG